MHGPTTTHRHAKGDERRELDELEDDGELVEEVESLHAHGLGDAREGARAGPGEEVEQVRAGQRQEQQRDAVVEREGHVDGGEGNAHGC